MKPFTLVYPLALPLATQARGSDEKSQLSKVSSNAPAAVDVKPLRYGEYHVSPLQMSCLAHQICDQNTPAGQQIPLERLSNTILCTIIFVAVRYAFMRT